MCKVDKEIMMRAESWSDPVGVYSDFRLQEQELKEISSSPKDLAISHSSSRISTYFITPDIEKNK